jgi:hypothetical protein
MVETHGNKVEIKKKAPTLTQRIDALIISPKAYFNLFRSN